MLLHWGNNLARKNWTPMLCHNLASLQNLWIQKCRKQKSLSMSLSIQHLTSLKSLEIRGCKEIDLFGDDGTQCVSVITLQSLIISKVPCLMTLHHFKYNQYAFASLGRYYNSSYTFYAIKYTIFFSLVCWLLCLQYWCLWWI